MAQNARTTAQVQTKPFKGVLNSWELCKFDVPGSYVVIGTLGTTDMRTSKILKIDFAEGKIETENSYYGLGTPKKG